MKKMWMQFVATEGRTSLHFEDAKQQAQFELGVSSAIFLWDDLAYAVDALLGGPESGEKREWMVGAVLDLFEAKEVDTDDIEDRLLQILEDEFEVTLETSSAHHVAEQVTSVYEQCARGDFDNVAQLYSRWQNIESQGARPRPVLAPAADSSSESSSDGESNDEDDGNSAPNLMEVDEKPQSRREQQGPTVDEDGFTVVRRR